MTAGATKTLGVFCEGGSLAHVTRVFEVGRALRSRYGHRVVFCCGGPYVHILREGGFEVVPVFTVDIETTLAVARSGKPPPLGWWRSVCDQAVASELAAISAVRPDAVIGDMRWTLSTSARAARVPYVSVTNACWTDKFAVPIELPETHIARRILGRGLARAAFPSIMRLSMAYGALGFSRVRRAHRLRRLRSMWEAVEGDVTLLADVPEFMPVKADTPPNVRYVGPILWNADIEPPPWLAKLDRSRPTVYFTMGSTGYASSFEEAVRVFGNTEFQLLMTTAGQVHIPDPPPNVFVANYAPGAALMGVSDVVVSHGGNGTIYQALAHGVPVIGVPTLFDQEINMGRVEALGLGRRLAGSQASGRALEGAVRAILGDGGYRERCKGMAALIARTHGPAEAALHIHDFLQHGKPAQGPAQAAAVGRDATNTRP
jgi:UDP:flavonoid glycosyltransferase YjiC (YdhE family)